MEINTPNDLLGLLSTKRPASTPMQVNPGAFPFAALSYSMLGEDLALYKVFKKYIYHRKMGFYVDVGCAAPFKMSNTYLFYCIGWRGLCIDANKDLTSLWQSQRGEDTFVNAAVGEGGGEGFLFRHTTNPGMNQLAPADAQLSADFLATPDRVPMMRLDELFAKHVPGGEIQFMSMDIEGTELSALKTNDWSRWRPEAIMMECQNFNFDDAYGEPSISYLRDRDYQLEYKVGSNVVMSDRTNRRRM